MKFKNPSNGYIEESDYIFLWTLLFGIFYFAYKGIWSHVFIGLLLGILTAGFSWLIYPFFSSAILEKHYLKNGWIEIYN
jgi:hypothetical protein